MTTTPEPTVDQLMDQMREALKRELMEVIVDEIKYEAREEIVARLEEWRDEDDPDDIDPDWLSGCNDTISMVKNHMF